MDTTKLRELLDQRDELDDQIRTLVGGPKERKPQHCKVCNSTEHTARNCPSKQA
jgi:hypothetical protein